MTALPQGGRYDLAVLGGGIMGLACAFEETLRGKRVAVLDPNPVGHKASWAAAGILAARAGLIGATPLRQMYLRSLYGYPEWLARVETESGVSIPYERDGDYEIFPLDNEDSIHALKERETQLRREKASNFSVTDELPDFLRAHSPMTRVRVFHFPGEARVQNRTLLEALEAALRKHGAEIFPVSPLSITRSERGSRITGEGWDLHTTQVLIAAGNWCDGILKLLGFSLPLSPVKGQLATLPNFHGQRCMVHCREGLYLVLRGDRLIAGATTESGVWNEDFDATGDAYLRDRIRTFFPAVEPEWLETWCGLRPCAADRLPLMGWVDQKKGIAICTGHYKSGISLAPMAARCMSALLNREKSPANLAVFDPHRSGGVKKQPSI